MKVFGIILMVWGGVLILGTLIEIGLPSITGMLLFIPGSILYGFGRVVEVRSSTSGSRTPREFVERIPGSKFKPGSRSRIFGYFLLFIGIWFVFGSIRTSRSEVWTDPGFWIGLLLILVWGRILVVVQKTKSIDQLQENKSSGGEV